MKRAELDKKLSKIFLDDWSMSEITKLEAAISLYGYYQEDDATEAVKESVRCTERFLLKRETFKTLMERMLPSMPRDFSCDFRNSEKQTASFSFEPTINIPPRNVSMEAEVLDRYDSLNAEVENIDVTLIMEYIKKKAIAAGDFVLE